MRIETKLLVNNKILLGNEVLPHYDEMSLITERKDLVKGNCLEFAKCTQLSTSGLIVLDVEMFFTDQETELFTIEGECVVMDFMYGGKVNAEVQYLGKPKYSSSKMHNTWYTTGFTGKYTLPAYQKVSYMLFIFSKAFYEKIFSACRSVYPEFNSNIQRSNPSYLSPKYLPFSPAMQWILTEIRDCNRTGILKRVFLENKIKELLLLQLEMYNRSLVKLTGTINASDLAKLQQAREILEADFINPPSLMELSRRISLNEFKLKKGFKHCYADTIRSFITKLRMNQAKRLLQLNSLSISEIAYQCGYKDLSHFSKMFKKYFGVPPKKLLSA